MPPAELPGSATPPGRGRPPDRKRTAGGGFPRAVLVFGVVLVVAATALVALTLSRHPSDGTTTAGQDTSVQPPSGLPSRAGPGASLSPSASARATPSVTPTHKASGPSTTQPNSPVNGKPPTPTLAGWPDSTNTGVPAGTKLTTVNGDLTIKTAGTVVDAKDIKGCIFIEANNVTVKRTRVTCPDAYGIRTFDSNKDYTGAKIQDTEINCNNQGFTGIAYSNYTALRLNIHGCENGFALGADATIQDSYIHDLKLTGSEHPDGAQLDEGSDNITFEHNTISAPITNSAIIMYTKDGTQNSNVLVDNNFLTGGGYTLYCPRANSSNVRVTNNRFGSANFGHTNGCTSGHVAVFSGNVDASTGAAIKAA